MVTETDELAAALDSAASRYPELSRAQLLIRLALEGQKVAQRAQEDRRRRRLDALREHSGALTGSYGEHYLEHQSPVADDVDRQAELEAGTPILHQACILGVWRGCGPTSRSRTNWFRS
jgi:hypothetical protein